VQGCRAADIGTERLLLTPLAARDAEEMAGVLDDARLHEFTGGAPASPAELRARCQRLAAGAPDPDVRWLNWIVRRRPAGQAVGAVQATVAWPARSAQVAWVIGTPWQGRGYAAEAARGLVGWLLDQGAATITACIHPDHHASARVAARAGLSPTADVVDGERVWRLTAA
jgi:RimJ/RimL family protein N-acetyltransferase